MRKHAGKRRDNRLSNSQFKRILKNKLDKTFVVLFDR